ncbi:MAG: hypothetical protein PHI18_08430 [bacterium]|nr:hypothetical protein [bacterium]
MRNSPAHDLRDFRGAAARGWRWLTRSVVVRVLLFGLVFVLIERHAAPWGLGWVRPDEAQEIAESFLQAQGVDLQKYTLLRAAEHSHDGVWGASGAEQRFAADPAIGYLFRYFQPGMADGWMIAVSPIGRIYRVRRQQLDDEPARRLSRTDALELTRAKLAADLHVAADSLNLRSDSLTSQVQRSDWHFVFARPQPRDSLATLTVTLGGEAITQFVIQSDDPARAAAPAQTPRARRVMGFVLILIGAFLIMHYHRTPLAMRSAVTWGGALFLLTALVRALTFSEAVILMPWDSPLTGYLSRVALAGVIEAVQAAILLGLVVATGESLSRDVLRGSTSLSRIAPGTSDWSAAWARAARWALPVGALVLIGETIVSHTLAPAGLTGKVSAMIAEALSSPLPPLTLPAEVALSVLWEESVFRLWLMALLLFWLRMPLLAALLAAAAGTYFAGYDFAQMLSAGALLYTAWGLIAGLLVLRVGIIAAMLFHALTVGAYAGLVMIWTGYGAPAGFVMIGALLLLILLVARDRSAQAFDKKHSLDSVTETS